MTEFRIINILDEQVAVGFTGKVNVLSQFNHQFLGHVIFKDGEVFNALFQGQSGLKAIYQLFVHEFSLQPHQYVIEPELVEGNSRNIHLPYADLKRKMSSAIKLHQESLKGRPPENVKILIDSEFLEDSLGVTQDEFEVLVTLTEWSNTQDVYQRCPLLDHEITGALVSLRRKNALRIIGTKDNL